ncbi:hypothetical protein OQA88_10582 [Cercophora sp. LCS_1]
MNLEGDTAAITPAISSEDSEIGGFDTSEFDPSDIDPDSIEWRSISSSIYRDSYENGRRYHTYRYGRYPIPNDDEEQVREEMKHAMHLELTEWVAFLQPELSLTSPVASSSSPLLASIPSESLTSAPGQEAGRYKVLPQPSLIAPRSSHTNPVADMYPSAEVIGTDLSPIQPAWVPPNLRFLVDDAEDAWPYTGPFDLIHTRNVVSMIKDLPRFLIQAHDHLKPGGWIEFQEFPGYVRFEAGSVENADVVRFWARLGEAMVEMGFRYWYSAEGQLGTMVEETGFQEVRCKTVKVPIGSWAKNKTLRLCGMYMRVSLIHFIRAMAARPLLVLGTPDEVEEIANKAIEELDKPGLRAFIEWRFWMGQKPKT